MTTTPLVLRETLPFIANPLDVSIGFFDTLLKVFELSNMTEQRMQALISFEETMQTFLQHLLKLRDVYEEKLESTTEEDITFIIYDSSAKESQNDKLLDQVNDTREKGKKEIQDILGFQIKKMEDLLGRVKTLQQK